MIFQEEKGWQIPGNRMDVLITVKSQGRTAPVEIMRLDISWSQSEILFQYKELLVKKDEIVIIMTMRKRDPFPICHGFVCPACSLHK